MVVRVHIRVVGHRRRYIVLRHDPWQPVCHHRPVRAAVEAANEAQVPAYEQMIVVRRVHRDHVVVERLVVHHVQVGLIVIRIYRSTGRVHPQAAPGLPAVVGPVDVLLCGPCTVLGEEIDARRVRVSRVARRHSHCHPSHVIHVRRRGERGDSSPGETVVHAAPNAPRSARVLRSRNPDLPTDAAYAPELLRSMGDVDVEE